MKESAGDTERQIENAIVQKTNTRASKSLRNIAPKHSRAHIPLHHQTDHLYGKESENKKGTKVQRERQRQK